jgi:RNA polymerase sigma-70 factor (ECF subfamily)
MLTNQDNQSHFYLKVLPEHPNAAHFNATDWRKASAGEASHLSEDILISAAQAGQEWAFVELCLRHSKRILFTLWRITKNREDAEDALQESMLKAHVHFGDFSRNSTFATWFTRIAINSALMILRKKRAHPEISTDEQIYESINPLEKEIADRRPNPEEHYMKLEMHRRLQCAISKLPSQFRHVVESRRRSEASIREIAEEAGISITATKSRLLRAKRALRKSILK